MFILKPKVKSKDFKGDHHPPLTLKVIKTLNNFVKTYKSYNYFLIIYEFFRELKLKLKDLYIWNLESQNSFFQLKAWPYCNLNQVYLFILQISGVRGERG